MWCTRVAGRHPAHSSCHLSRQTSLTPFHATFCTCCFCPLRTKPSCRLPIHCSVWPVWSKAWINLSAQKGSNFKSPGCRKGGTNCWIGNIILTSLQKKALVTVLWPLLSTILIGKSLCWLFNYSDITGGWVTVRGSKFQTFNVTPYVHWGPLRSVLGFMCEPDRTEI